MPKAWLTIPSARDEEISTVKLWRRQGYGVALFRDEGASAVYADVVVSDKYPGYACAVNRLVALVLERDPECQFVIAAGDDVQPDLNHSAEYIVAQCNAHFHVLNRELGVLQSVGCESVDTFGVMQPTGDRWGEDETHLGARGSAYIDRVCGSAWIGREFARRVNQGKGPLWPEYWHMYADEHLQGVAEKLGVLWQRRDLIHLHDHWGRGKGKTSADRPKFLDRANSAEEWKRGAEILKRHRAEGFAQSLILAD